MTRPSLRPGQVVRATVTHAAAYGFYLVHEGVQIFVHATELPWLDGEVDHLDEVRIGDVIDVTILRLTEEEQPTPVATFPRPGIHRDRSRTL